MLANVEEEEELAAAAYADKKEETNQVVMALDGQQKMWLNGLELLEDVKWNMRILPTGYEGIDVLLGGGIREGQLTEIVGPSSSGKTQIACIINQQSKVVTKDAVEKILKMTMGSIFCQSVFDIFELFAILRQLEHKLKQQVKSGPSRICLLIIDSLSSLIAPILGGQGSQGRHLMVSTGILLKKLAHEHNLSILVTNHMVAGEGGILKPALGESWKSIPHVRLLLSCDQGSNNCSISVLKHTAIASCLTAKFVIPN